MFGGGQGRGEIIKGSAVTLYWLITPKEMLGLAFLEHLSMPWGGGRWVTAHIMTALTMVTTSAVMGLNWVHTWFLSQLRDSLHLNLLTLCSSILILARRRSKDHAFILQALCRLPSPSAWPQQIA